VKTLKSLQKSMVFLVFLIVVRVSPMFALNEQEYQWLKDFSKTMQTHSTETLQLFFLYQDDYASLISLKTAIDDVKYKSLWMADLLNLYLKSDCESEKISLTGTIQVRVQDFLERLDSSFRLVNRCASHATEPVVRDTALNVEVDLEKFQLVLQAFSDDLTLSNHAQSKP
jgi:hypothetical protein